MKYLLNSLLTFFCFAFPAHAQKLAITSTGADFQQFWAQANGKDLAEQEELWLQFERKYADVYEQLLPDLTTSDGHTLYKEKIQHLLRTLPVTEKTIFQLYANAEKLTASQGERFKRQFPDMQDGMQIIFLPTLGINGAQRYLKSKDAWVLIIGVDRIAETGESLDVLFSHEFFHLYLSQKISHLKSGSSMASPLWHEGLATYVSKMLNPESTLSQQLMQEDLAEACIENNIKTWAKDYSTIMMLEPQGKQYADWFRVISSQDIKRRGYCLGLRAVSKIAETHNIMEMTTWGESSFTPKLQQALINLSH